MKKSILIGKELPIETVIKEPVFLLLDVVEIYKYDESNNKTDVVEGYCYQVVETNSFEKLSVKIKGKGAIISRDSLLSKRESGEKIAVELINGKVKMYYSSYYNTYVDSFTAESIHFVENIDIF